MGSSLKYEIFPLGDSALTLDYGNIIGELLNNEVIAHFRHLQHYPIPGMIEAVPAYSSLTIHYDLCSVMKNINSEQTVFQWMKEKLIEQLEQNISIEVEEDRKLKIPVCYEKEFAADLNTVAESKGLTVEEIVSFHSGKYYKVYMLGFLPGFPYMGEVDEKLIVTRKPQPMPVTAGSVGLAGKQTGVYPLNSPGGWQIIGKTPLKLFDADRNDPALFRAGDRVRFYSISKNDFNEIENNQKEFIEKELFREEEP